MRIVEKEEAINGPGLCIFTSDIDGPFLDTGFWVDSWANPYAYIHVPFVEQMGREVGMVARNEVERLAERVEAAEAECESLREQVEALTTIREAVPA
jgi:hypothetical protein